ncbi:hypothetical protein V6N11_007333 [Hibiscus sabdariffa]|uniref:Uncharacterized protein n=1 Tax=Hibiscus sabdariffa TaxID=183260 RepID=A0ABR1ZN30_9ROSI
MIQDCNCEHHSWDPIYHLTLETILYALRDCHSSKKALYMAIVPHTVTNSLTTMTLAWLEEAALGFPSYHGADHFHLSFSYHFESLILLMSPKSSSGLAIGGLAHCPLGCHDRALVEALVVPIGLLLLEIGAGTRWCLLPV